MQGAAQAGQRQVLHPRLGVHRHGHGGGGVHLHHVPRPRLRPPLLRQERVVRPALQKYDGKIEFKGKKVQPVFCALILSDKIKLILVNLEIHVLKGPYFAGHLFAVWK